ncbi:MAG: holin [Eubacterium sp.]|jgi:hypothetical protein|nr:holin [Eubacterium sp.]
MTKQFWLDVLERAVKTAAHSAIAVIGTHTVLGEVDWKVVLSVTAMSTIMSVLTSIASHSFGDKGTASILKTNIESEGK